jgi:hypothetical protein
MFGNQYLLSSAGPSIATGQDASGMVGKWVHLREQTERCPHKETEQAPASTNQAVCEDF